jgi:hypothetical protein
MSSGQARGLPKEASLLLVSGDVAVVGGGTQKGRRVDDDV